MSSASSTRRGSPRNTVNEGQVGEVLAPRTGPESGVVRRRSEPEAGDRTQACRTVERKGSSTPGPSTSDPPVRCRSLSAALERSCRAPLHGAACPVPGRGVGWGCPASRDRWARRRSISGAASALVAGGRQEKQTDEHQSDGGQSGHCRVGAGFRQRRGRCREHLESDRLVGVLRGGQ